MATALILLCAGCLLQDALCKTFRVKMPQAIETVEGSCVTIPCSFDIEEKHESNLDKTCKAKWESKNTIGNDKYIPLTMNVKPTGNVTEKDCTTTLNQITSNSNKRYRFRLECLNKLKYTFQKQSIHISAKAVPPSPKLCPSTLNVKDGTSVTLKCSAPAPCVSHPPNITWTPGLGESQETITVREDKTEVKSSVLIFNISQLHHGKEISCTATYSREGGRPASSVTTRLTAVVLFSPQILNSSHCTKTPTEVNCSCESVGNPLPTLSWYFNGIIVRQLETFGIITKHINDTVLKSTISLNQSHWQHNFTLVCNSSNSLGSLSQPLYNNSHEQQTSAETLDREILTILIIILFCVLLPFCTLVVIISFRFLCCSSSKPGTDNTIQYRSSSEENEIPNSEKENIYANISDLRQSDVSHPTSTGGGESIEKKDEDDNDVLYSTVTVKRINKKKQQKWCHCEDNSVDLHLPNSSCTLEKDTLNAQIETKKMKTETECEYSQVMFKNRCTM